LHSMKAADPFMLGYNNPGGQVVVSTKLCSMGLILAGPLCGIFSCPLLAPRILSYLPRFWKKNSIILYCVHMRRQIDSVHNTKAYNSKKNFVIIIFTSDGICFISVVYLKIIPLLSLIFLCQTDVHLYTGHYAPKSTHTRP